MLLSLGGHSIAVASEFGESPAERAFYVRGDFGYAFNRLGSFGQADVIGSGGEFIDQNFGDSPIVGAGVGVRLASWLRFDLTGEYRFSANVRAVDHLESVLTNPDGLFEGSTTYRGRYTAIVGLANAYIDLPKWSVVTPYIGGGIGFARNKFSGFETVSNGSFHEFATGDVRSETEGGFAGAKSTTSFAWALMAGVGIDLDEHATLDLGYRYVHLGSSLAVSTDIIDCSCGTIGSPLTGSDLESHEFRIGLRYEFSTATPDNAAPLK